MKRLPCGHIIIDPTGTFCAHPDCGEETVKINETKVFLRSEAKKEGVSYHVDAQPNGIIKPALDRQNPERRKFLKLIRDGVPLATLGAMMGMAYITLSGKREKEHKQTRQWQRFIIDLDNAIEAEDKASEIRRIEAAAGGTGSITNWLCKGALEHLCNGEPESAQDRYKLLIREDWDDLPREVKRHLLKRLGKVSSLLGNPFEAAVSFQRIVKEELNLNPVESLETIREALNAWYQTLPASALLSPSLSSDHEGMMRVEELLKDAALQLKVNDIRELPEPYNGLRPGIGLFQEILDYVRTHDAQYLENHFELITEMIRYRQTTGWNRYSQFIALALAGGELDYARKGLSAALSWVVGRPLKEREVEEEAIALARTRTPLEPKRNPGPIELAIHLAMWGQYESARSPQQARTSPPERSAEFFASARKLLADHRHRRFIRDLDRFLAASELDPLLATTTRVPGQVRCYGPEQVSTAVFLPLVPKSLPEL